MAIEFETKYPAALKNSAWQKKKSFKDKTKAKTKTGLGDALTLAEKDWGKIKFANMSAGNKLAGKSVAEWQEAKKAAKAYKSGEVVTKAIASLEAAASKARTTAKNTALSATAAKAAADLSGALLRQAKLLKDIKLTDYNPPVAVQTNIGRWENQHTEALHSVDNLRDALKDTPDLHTWEHSNFDTLFDGAVKVTAGLAEATGDKHWTDMNERWRRLFVAYNTTNQRVKSMSAERAKEEFDNFTDLVQSTMGGVFM